MKMNEKIRILLKNNEFTQTHLAKLLDCSPDTVQKWVKGKNAPRIDSIKDICGIFQISYQAMLDDDVDIPEFNIIDHYLPYNQHSQPSEDRDSEHTIIDAGLENEAFLHRFRNCAGADCSAIYRGNIEVWWHYRDNEAQMIHDWNERYRR